MYLIRRIEGPRGKGEVTSPLPRAAGDLAKTILVKKSRLIILWLLVGSVGVTGCVQQMAYQPYYRPLEPSSFFKDNMSSRPLVPDTVARGHLQTDTELYTGKMASTPVATASSGAGQAGQPGAGATPVPFGVTQPISGQNYTDRFPFPITRDVLLRGQERFNIYCAPCHDRAGTGNGMVVQRGFPQPPSYHTDQLRQMPVGQFFDVITNGFGRMPPYSHQIAAEDRWAIIAYIRALQLSQHAPLDAVPPDERQNLGEP